MRASVIDYAFAAVFDQVLEQLKCLHDERLGHRITLKGVDTYLVNLPPLASFFFHELRVDAWHDLVEVLAAQPVASEYTREQSDVAYKLNVLTRRCQLYIASRDYWHVPLGNLLHERGTRTPHTPCQHISAMSVQERTRARRLWLREPWPPSR